MKKGLKNNKKEIIINSIISSIIITILVYIIIGPFNKDFVKLLETISKQGNEVTIIFILFPCILICYICINILKAIINKK